MSSEPISPERAFEAAAGRLPEAEAQALYAAVEKMRDPDKQRDLRREMILAACERKNARYIQFVWTTLSHPFSDPANFTDKMVAALKTAGHQDADRHRAYLEYVADADADEDTWTWRIDEKF